MTDPETNIDVPKRTVSKLPFVAVLVSLIGLADSVYLTVHHYTAEAVPCGEMFDCEMVLTSPYATLGGIIRVFSPEAIPSTSAIGGIPLAAFGALAYFVAFSLCLLTAFGDRRMWKLFGVQVTLMVVFSGWLFYVQAAIIGAFCQFCLLSAGTTLTLFSIYIISIFAKPRA